MELARAMEIVTRKVIVNAEHSKRAWNVMLAAIEANKIPVDKVLEIIEDYKITLLHLACRCEDVSVAVVQRLLELGASSSWADRSGNVAMHKAAQGCDYNSFEKCKMLPAADLGCRNSRQETPLHQYVRTALAARGLCDAPGWFVDDNAEAVRSVYRCMPRSQCVQFRGGFVRPVAVAAVAAAAAGAAGAAGVEPAVVLPPLPPVS